MVIKKKTPNGIINSLCKTISGDDENEKESNL